MHEPNGLPRLIIGPDDLARYTGGVGLSVMNEGLAAGRTRELVETETGLSAAFSGFFTQAGGKYDFTESKILDFKKGIGLRVARIEGCFVWGQTNGTYLILYPNVQSVLKGTETRKLFLLSRQNRAKYSQSVGVSMVGGALSGGRVTDIIETESDITVLFSEFVTEVSGQYEPHPAYRMQFYKKTGTGEGGKSSFTMEKKEGFLVLRENEDSALVIYPNASYLIRAFETLP